MTFDQTFTFAQALDLVGMLQCVFILSIIYLNAVDLRQAAPSIAFFAVLGLSFGLPAAGGAQSFAWQAASIWVAQAWIPTVSYFLVLQVAMGRLPETRHLIVFVLPMIGPIAVLAATLSGESCGGQLICAESVPLLRVFGVIPGAVVMLLLWAHRGLFVQLREARDSTNRYWAVIWRCRRCLCRCVPTSQAAVSTDFEELYQCPKYGQIELAIRLCTFLDYQSFVFQDFADMPTRELQIDGRSQRLAGVSKEVREVVRVSALTKRTFLRVLLECLL